MTTFVPIEVLALAEIEARRCRMMKAFMSEGWARDELIRWATQTIKRLDRAGYVVKRKGSGE